MSAPAFIDVRGLAYVDSEHPVSCGSKSRAIGKSGKRRELYPRAIPTLCDCGVRDAARKKREQLHNAAPEMAEALVALLKQFGPAEVWDDDDKRLACENASAVLRKAGRLP